MAGRAGTTGVVVRAAITTCPSLSLLLPISGQFNLFPYFVLYSLKQDSLVGGLPSAKIVISSPQFRVLWYPIILHDHPHGYAERYIVAVLLD